jgi:hypothetical protein
MERNPIPPSAPRVESHCPMRASLLFLPLRNKLVATFPQGCAALGAVTGAQVGKCSSVSVLVPHTHTTAADIHLHRVSAHGQP